MTGTTLQTPHWLLSGKGRQSRLSVRRQNGPHKTSPLSNRSWIPVIGVLFQLASKSQTLLTFLGNSCRNGLSQQISLLSVTGLCNKQAPNRRKKIYIPYIYFFLIYFDRVGWHHLNICSMSNEECLLWPHVSGPANKSIICLQPDTFTWLLRWVSTLGINPK